jgi:ribonuclease HII
VVAACVVLEPERIPDGITDSKKLSEAARERLAAAIRERARVGVGQASAAEIDALNIHHATLLAMRRAYAALPGPEPAFALVDGKFAPELPCPAEALVGGDGLSLSIAAASIIAKVARDALLREMDARHPQYGFARHKGYATKEHLEALMRHGPCPEHRKSFRPVAEALARAGDAESLTAVSRSGG